MNLMKARELLGDNKLIGVTIHSEDEISDRIDKSESIIDCFKFAALIFCVNSFLRLYFY